jgi:hypothetical protein
MVIEKSKLILVKEYFIMKLHEEFKLYENMWDTVTDEATELHVLFSGPSTEDDWPSKIYKIYLADEDQNRFYSGFEAALAEFWKSYPDEDISLYEILMVCSAADANKIKAAVGVEVSPLIKKLILNSNYDVLTQDFGGDYMNPFNAPEANPWIKKYIKP